MTELFRQLQRYVHERIERHRNQGLLRAAMAACASVAVADDGRVTLRERVRIDRILESLERLKVFDPHEGVELFNQHVELLRSDPAEGRRIVEEAVRAQLDAEPECAALLVRICLAVSLHGGEVAPSEREAIGSLCAAVHIDQEMVDQALQLAGKPDSRDAAI